MPISTTYLKTAKLALSIALASLLSTAAHALVPLSLSDSESAMARISIKDPTRIRVVGAAITDVVGAEIASDTNPAGRLQISSNDRGEVFVQPTDPAMPATSLFISTPTATYTLVLAPASIPGDTIEISPVASTNAEPVEIPELGPGRLPNYEKALVSLLRDIAADRPPAGMRVIEHNIKVELWLEVDFVLFREYVGHPRWRVEAFLLTNVSNARLVIDEREFLGRGIAAVGLEQADLAPGHSTVVRLVHHGVL